VRIAIGMCTCTYLRAALCAVRCALRTSHAAAHVARGGLPGELLYAVRVNCVPLVLWSLVFGLCASPITQFSHHALSALVETTGTKSRSGILKLSCLRRCGPSSRRRPRLTSTSTTTTATR
jgi:hypothetical protein